MRLLLPVEIPLAYPHCSIKVLEGEDDVLRALTPEGQYYVIGFYNKNSQINGRVAYITSPRFCIHPHLQERPYQTRSGAEKDAARIRRLQRKQRKLGDAGFDFRQQASIEMRFQNSEKVLGWGPVPDAVPFSFKTKKRTSPGDSANP